MAEREGFEPPIPVKVCPLSRRIVSTAHAPLRDKISCLAVPFALFRFGNHARLTAVLKERLQQRCALARQKSGTNFHLMIQTRVIYHFHHRANRAGFRVVSPVNQALDASVYYSSRTHGTRFDCSKQRAADEAVITKVCGGLAQRHDLGMRRRIELGKITIPAAADDVSVADHNRTYRHFSHFQGTLCAAESLFHEKFVGRRCRGNVYFHLDIAAWCSRLPAPPSIHKWGFRRWTV
jgi:hypothetical protein